MAKRYIIGTKPVPEWCADLLQPFRKTDGTTAVEFIGDNQDINLYVGDILIKRGNNIKFERRRESERKGIFESV
jgi:hypothetical protein